MMLRFLLCPIPEIALAEVQQGPPNANFAPAFAALLVIVDSGEVLRVVPQ
jgi:hypothetical protein